MTSVPEKDVCSLCGARRIDQQLGLEPTPEEYIERMVEVFREVRRVLRSDGTCWVNLGDSYASAYACDRRSVVGAGSPDETCQRPNRLSGGLKEKDLCMMPHRLALALQADGWWVRADIVWAKPNPLPESVTDRPTKSHEFVFLLTKAARYFYDADAVREATQPNNTPVGRDNAAGIGSARHFERGGDGFNKLGDDGQGRGYAKAYCNPAGRNLRSVWTIATQAFPGAHFACYPEKLVLPCLRAGTSERGACPECGAAWRRVVETQPVERPRKQDGSVGWEPGCECWGQLKACGADAQGEYHGEAQKDYDSASAQNPSDTKRRILAGMKKRAGQTHTWEPGCECLVGPLAKWHRAGALRLPKWAQEGLHHWLAAQYDMPKVPCVVLDPFGGSGTTALVAEKLGLDSIIVELNEEYVALAEKRLGAQGRLEL